MSLSRLITLLLLLVAIIISIFSSQVSAVTAFKSSQQTGHIVPSPVQKKILLKTRAGNMSGTAVVKTNSIRQTTMKNVLGIWSVLQVLSILLNAVKRLIPIALEPIIKKDLEPMQAVICVVWCIYMAYTEGYQAFQRKFSPLVVKRAFGLSRQPTILKCLLAGPYSMGLFGSTKKRMIVSWSVTLGVFAIVKAVKKLPYPWRSIVDAGVVVGLTYGALSMCIQTVRACFGWSPDCDECLPDIAPIVDEKKA